MPMTLAAAALSLLLAPSPSGIPLQALLPTSGDAAGLLDGSGAGWTPAGDPRGEGVLFRLEQNQAVREVRIKSCPSSGALTLLPSLNGNEQQPLKIAPGETGAVSVSEGEQAGLRSFFLKVVEAKGTACLASVVFQGPGGPLAVQAPRSVAGTVSASSTRDPLDAYHPAYAFDGRLDFGWVAGGNKVGEGESLHLTLEHPVEVTRLQIWNGYQRSTDHFKKNARAKAILFAAGDRPPVTLTLRDAMGPSECPLPAAVTASSFTFTVGKTIAGTAYRDLVISEIRLFDHAGPFAVRTSDAAARSAALKAEIAGKPLASVVDRETDAVCSRDSRSLKLRSDHTFVWYDLGEGEEPTREVFDGVWVVTKQGMPWSTIELYGRRHTMEQHWEPYSDTQTKITDKVAGGNLQIARLSDLGAAGFRDLVAQWKKGAADIAVSCLKDGDFESYAKDGVIAVKGPAITELLDPSPAP